MKKFVFLQHVADVLFEASGKTFPEALEGAAQALFETIADTKQLAKKEKVAVEEKAPSLEELTVFVLSDLLSASQTRELFLKEFSVKEFKERRKKQKEFFVKGVAAGERARMEVGKTDVKAVTFHELRVAREEDEWKIRVLLDV